MKISLDIYNDKYALSSGYKNDIVSLDERILALTSLKTNENNSFELEFVNSILSLSGLNSVREYSDHISRLLYGMEDPANGNKVFETFEKQKKALQSALESVDHSSMMGEGIMAVLLGVTNAESQMTKWMQDIVLSGGEIKEFEEW
ncbi:hypothetical protein [Providencia rustigianii]|uniref:hypothetical protein n=1 Tax=Providencia rustigianii TaxID=158850 RepID=UPI0038B40EA9